MKKLALIILVAISIVSCKKESQTCNCGLVINDDVTDYSVTIRNSCSGNERRFVLEPGDWINAGVGENYCIYNVTSW